MNPNSQSVQYKAAERGERGALTGLSSGFRLTMPMHKATTSEVTVIHPPLFPPCLQLYSLLRGSNFQLTPQTDIDQEWLYLICHIKFKLYVFTKQ